VLVGGMRRRAPFDLIRQVIGRTGVMRDGNKHYIYVGVLRGTDAEKARIANVWEFGGRDAPGAHKRKPRPGIEAHPFIRPALRNDSGAARAAMVKIFEEWLK